jgi:hypothetical protein
MRALKILLGFAAFLTLMVIGSSVANLLLTPRRASPAALEATFRDQIARLRNIAYDHTRWHTTVEECKADRRLFNRKEILYASVDLSDNSHLLEGDRDFDMRTDVSLFSPSLSGSRVTRHWYKLSDGSHVSGVSYQSSVIDKHGREVGITLIVDLSKLHE